MEMISQLVMCASEVIIEASQFQELCDTVNWFQGPLTCMVIGLGIGMGIVSWRLVVLAKNQRGV